MFERCAFTDVIFTSVIYILEGQWWGYSCRGLPDRGSGGCGVWRFRGVAPYVFLKGAFVTEGVVAHQGLLVEKAIEAFPGAVAQDGGVVAAAVGGVVLGLCVSGLAAYPTMFICVRSRAGV